MASLVDTNVLVYCFDPRDPGKQGAARKLLSFLSEDFQHGRHYGGVRAVNPFLPKGNRLHELPALYEA